ncbi:MAG: CRISPR-associated endonuclease Cas2 [Oscillospiraceae bacterium]|nr:CRISPR-associated endonuclease Cas2 [Oscillospiraceae bacterium]
MFVILTYDVGQKRVSKVMKTCRRYLQHVQNSVFEGTITETRLNKLKAELEKIIEKEVDNICIYELASVKYSRKVQIGAVAVFDNIIT